MSKQSVTLNYVEDISYIIVSDKGRLGTTEDGIFSIEIYDKEDIEKILNYLNSLELIEEIPSFEYFPDLNERFSYFSIDIIKVGYEEDDTAHDLLSFQTTYMSISRGGFDCRSTIYYIKDSGYNPITKSSKTYEFLNELING